MTETPDKKTNDQSLIPVQVSPKEKTDEPLRIKKSFLRWAGEILGLMHRYTVEDLCRLKEAAISEREGLGRKANAEAAKLIAEAANLQAEADLKNAKISAIRNSTEDRQDAALDRVLDAISNIKQQGGSVASDSEQLEHMLKQQLIERKRVETEQLQPSETELPIIDEEHKLS